MWGFWQAARQLHVPSACRGLLTAAILVATLIVPMAFDTGPAQPSGDVKAVAPRGVSEKGRSATYKKRGLWAIKKKHGGEFPKQEKQAKKDAEQPKVSGKLDQQHPLHHTCSHQCRLCQRCVSYLVHRAELQTDSPPCSYTPQVGLALTTHLGRPLRSCTCSGAQVPPGR